MPTDFADLTRCAEHLAHGSRTFRAASRLLPARVRLPAFALYAFCRIADDAVDAEVLNGAPEAASGRLGLQRMRARLDRIYLGRPVDAAADRAFATVVSTFEIPRALPDALLEGFEWDAQGRRPADLAALEAYAARVAGSVGAMMAIVMGADSPAVLQRACELGVAMQLSNIARDVGEDARARRLYLPLDWLAQEGIDPDRWLENPVHDAALARVIARLLARADELYARATAGIAHLPLDCRPGILAARLLYAEIGNEVARRGFDSIASRAVVGPTRKLSVLVKTVALPRARPLEDRLPGTRETHFLVMASARALARASHRRPRPMLERALRPFQRIGDKAVWVLELMDRLERSERMLAASSRPETMRAAGSMTNAGM